MKKINNSLYGQLITHIIFSAAFSLFLFFFLSSFCDHSLNAYLKKTNYDHLWRSVQIERLQKFITDKHLSTDDLTSLTPYLNSSQISLLQLYDNGNLLYEWDNFGDNDMEKEESYFSVWRDNFFLSFADINAEVYIAGANVWKLYAGIKFIILVLCFLIFIFALLIFIKSKIKYILILNHEIQILESGDLDYCISVKGTDELFTLANSLDNMRKALKDQIKKETLAVQENQRMIREMSHDLRTPLTSLLLYIKFLHDLCPECNTEAQHYIEKIDTKLHQLKQQADHIFEYSLINQEPIVPLEFSELFKETIYDFLSSLSEYLSQNGFRTILRFKWDESKVCINYDYLVRIFDNISSNIIKYASSKQNIYVTTSYNDTYEILSFTNTKKLPSAFTSSSKTGLISVMNMMMKMNGKIDIINQEHSFSLRLFFPKISIPKPV